MGDHGWESFKTIVGVGPSQGDRYGKGIGQGPRGVVARTSRDGLAGQAEGERRGSFGNPSVETHRDTHTVVAFGSGERRRWKAKHSRDVCEPRVLAPSVLDVDVLVQQGADSRIAAKGAGGGHLL